MDTAKSVRCLSVSCAAIALAGSLLAATPAHAGAAPERRAVIVRYNDLNLDSATGAGTLYRRIGSAARTVCGREEVSSLAEALQFQRCYDSAVARAIAAVGSPMLSRLAGRTARSST
jgi:UrcA family protein